MGLLLQVVTGKGHEKFQIEGDKTEFFDDGQECREALEFVGELHQGGIDTSEFPWRCEITCHLSDPSLSCLTNSMSLIFL